MYNLLEKTKKGTIAIMQCYIRILLLKKEGIP